MNPAPTAGARAPSLADLPEPGLAPPALDLPTLWGLRPVDLHDRFWACRAVQVVRVGEPTAIVPHAELYLLTDARALTVFRPAPLLDNFYWFKPDFALIRIVDKHKRGYFEWIESDDAGRFKRLHRVYEGTRSSVHRVALTADPQIARIWQESASARAGWSRLRQISTASSRYATKVPGRVFDQSRPEEVRAFAEELVKWWPRPDVTIDALRSPARDVWVPRAEHLPANARVIGPLWIGAGRLNEPDLVAAGPGVLWDKPDARPLPAPVGWQTIEPLNSLATRSLRPSARITYPGKRLLDIILALIALALTLPLYPLIALAIWLEDRGPIFFGHERESIGGRRFKCWKFRSMRRDADKIKQQFMGQNKADGPQFFIPNDPRLTRIGRRLRDLQFDEFPQFWNVLVGDMSIVGPRPSPFSENQFCPAWREARLSVRPGITGLWQISRTRAEGTDFQEWIRYDVEYVEQASLWLDLKIIWKTVVMIVRRVTFS